MSERFEGAGNIIERVGANRLLHCPGGASHADAQIAVAGYTIQLSELGFGKDQSFTSGLDGTFRLCARLDLRDPAGHSCPGCDLERRACPEAV